MTALENSQVVCTSPDEPSGVPTRDRGSPISNDLNNFQRKDLPTI